MNQQINKALQAASYDLPPIISLNKPVSLPTVEVPPQPTADVEVTTKEEIQLLIEEQTLLKLRLENEQLRRGQMPLSVSLKFDTKTLITVIGGAIAAIGLSFLKGC